MTEFYVYFTYLYGSVNRSQRGSVDRRPLEVSDRCSLVPSASSREGDRRKQARKRVLPLYPFTTHAPFALSGRHNS
ncbi:hypothetical protein [Oxynema aestuarii]|uniref:Uncharacterized protein n=1 Tax=Oxynema aestuarii AP17 TaxID=2064643 RepID=A0A6H1U0S0_9CYAN|nr:hypothetical protein [Oxynema aestuarii]QIZ72434.1 hypothetical protein HCG48_19115 [Oxynema aestuarii AP17]